MSVYSYFADKQNILVALAEDVFGELARRAERNAPADPLQALAHGMREFAAFGLENPNEYRTIFLTPMPSASDRRRDEPEDKKNPALQSMRRAVRACLDAGMLDGDEHAVTTYLWTTVNGAVAAMINFPAYSFGDRNRYAETVIQLALAGVKARPVAALTGSGGCR